MKIALVTSNPHSYCSEFVKEYPHPDDLSIVLNKSSKPRNKSKLFSKVKKIGLLGSLIGIYNRKLYQNKFDNVLDVANKRNIRVIKIDNFLLSQSQKKSLKNMPLGISMQNGYIPSSFFQLFQCGMINVHHEVLPEYPGAQSVFWHLFNNDPETGYSIHQISKKIDKGGILKVERMPIKFCASFNQTITTNYKMLIYKSIQGLIEILGKSPEYWEPTYPDKNYASYTTPSFKEYLVARRNYNQMKSQFGEESC